MRLASATRFRRGRLARFDAIAALAVSVACTSWSARADLTLVGPGVPPCPILVASNAAPQERAAADQLAGYLKQITGAEFPVVAAAAGRLERAIVVGAAAGAAADPLRSPESFVVTADDSRLTIAGRTARGTAYGVFAFLEEHLGCRWWSKDEEDVPRQAAIMLAPFRSVTEPPFSMHNLMNVEAQNPRNSFALKSRATSIEGFSGSHTLYPLLTPYATNHPEVYPMNPEGVRKANKLHFCYMAPGIAEALADALGRAVERNGGSVSNTIYFAGMGDWYGGMCECPLCKPVYEEEAWTDPDGRKKPGYTATLLRMINRTAGILDRRYPGIRVGTFAYMSLEAPPLKTAPASNVVIRVPRLRHCTVHASEECDKNASYRRNLERWCELAPRRVYVWEYGTNFKNFIYPFPCLHSIAENIRYYRRIGLRGGMIQGNYVTTGSDLVVLKNYVWRKLWWNPDLDTGAVLREFCGGYYGPASSGMVAYVEGLEAAVREPKPVHADEFAGPGYLSADARAGLKSLRAAALAAAAGVQPFDRRVREATAGLEVLELDRPVAFRAEGDALVRADTGTPTLARAVDAIAHIRDAGPNEWGTGRSYWLRFLQMQGGPLAVLSNGDVRVSVAPLLRGQIRQITFGGHDLLHVDSATAEKDYPLRGGSIAGGYGSGLMRFAAAPTPTNVVMDDGIEIGAWRFNAKPSVRQEVTLDRDGALSVRAFPLAKAAPAAATVTTVYRADVAERAGSAMSAAFQGSSGSWTPIEITASTNGFALPRTNITAISIRFKRTGCTVTDYYDGTPIASGRLVFDPKDKTLAVSVRTATNAPATGGPRPILERRIVISSTSPVQGP